MLEATRLCFLPLSEPATREAQRLTVILSTLTKYEFFKSLCMFVTAYFSAIRNSKTTPRLKPKSPYHDILTTSCTSAKKHMFCNTEMASGTSKIDHMKNSRHPVDIA
jgi:hypothetical protein